MSSNGANENVNGGWPGPHGIEDRHDSKVQAQYDVSFEFSADCLLVTDAQGLIVKANHAAVALLAYPKHFVIGKPLGLFVVKERCRPRFYKSLWRLCSGASSDTFETRVTCRGGELRDVLLSGRGDSEGGRYCWLLHDISELKKAEAERLQLLQRVVNAQEDERRRIARDLHDNIGQLLTVLSLGVDAISGARMPPDAEAPLALLQRTVGDLNRAVRELALRLRPAELDDLGLHAALQQLVTDWSALNAGVRIRFDGDTVKGFRFPHEVETTVYRIFQEALTNVFRHARARQINLGLEWQGGVITATVSDDGIGFDPENVVDAPSRGRLGLVGMRQRAALIGGLVEIGSMLGKGTTLRARYPARAITSCPPEIDLA